MSLCRCSRMQYCVCGSVFCSFLTLALIRMRMGSGCNIVSTDCEGTWRRACLYGVPQLTCVVRVSRVDDLPEGWSCSVKAGLPGRFVVQYVSKEGISIKSKRQLRSYLEERGVGDSAIEQISARADFSKYVCRL